MTFSAKPISAIHIGSSALAGSGTTDYVATILFGVLPNEACLRFIDIDVTKEQLESLRDRIDAFLLHNKPLDNVANYGRVTTNEQDHS